MLTFESVGVSPGEPAHHGSAKGQECHSRCRNERRLVNGRARGVRYARTTGRQWTVNTKFCLCSLTLGVVSSDSGYGRSWLMVLTSNVKDSSAGDNPAMTLIDTAESL